jgi:hypothetical protein
MSMTRNQKRNALLHNTTNNAAHSLKPIRASKNFGSTAIALQIFANEDGVVIDTSKKKKAVHDPVHSQKATSSSSTAVSSANPSLRIHSPTGHIVKPASSPTRGLGYNARKDAAKSELQAAVTMSKDEERTSTLGRTRR